MPVQRITCPHCEKAVELQVTTVTRSRPCPSCEAVIFLQVAEKEKKVKRRALLMESTVLTGAETSPTPLGISGGAPGGGAQATGLPYEPQPLAGEAFERMRSDPQLARFRKALVTGTTVVVLIAVALTAAHFYQKNQTEKARQKLEEQLGGTSLPGSPAAADESAPLPDVAVDIPAPVTPPTTTGLQFTTPTGAKQASAAAQPSPAPVTEAAPSALMSNPRDVLDAFLKAPTWRERLRYSFDQVVAERQMKSFYEHTPDSSFDVIAVKESQATTPGIQEFDVELDGSGTRRASVVRSRDGYLVDWASFVLYSDMSFEKLKREQPTTPTLLRVWVRPGAHYAGAFADPSWLRCLELRPADDPDGPVIYAYAEKNSTVGGEIDYWMRMAENRALEWTVRVRFPADAITGDQVWLHQLVSSTWLVARRR